MSKICKLRCHKALKQPYSNHVYDQLKQEGKSAKEAVQIISICGQIDQLVSNSENVAKVSRGTPENSLSVNTSDADGIESEYYVEEAIDNKVNSMNKNFEGRVQLMTKVMADRIEESSSSDEYHNLVKLNRKDYLYPNEEGHKLASKRKYLDAFRKSQDSSYYKRQRTDEDEYEFIGRKYSDLEVF